MRRFVTMAVMACGLSAGCGGAASDTSDPAPNGNGAESNEADDRLAKVQEALGEPGCGAVAADATLDFAKTTQVVSPNTYGHPSCTNGFVVDVLNAPPGALFEGGVSGRLDPFSCVLLYGYVSLWQKQGSSYVKIQEAATFGHGSFCSAQATMSFPLTGTGTYRIVSSAGFFFGLFQLPTTVGT